MHAHPLSSWMQPVVDLPEVIEPTVTEHVTLCRYTQDTLVYGEPELLLYQHFPQSFSISKAILPLYPIKLK
jgi:hypothetical protein